MYAERRLPNPPPGGPESGFELLRDCAQIRERLDDLFGGVRPLENTDPGLKGQLFAHLETCPDCCRALDVRIRFGIARRAIF